MATYQDALKKYPEFAWAFNIPEIGNLLKAGVDDPGRDIIPELIQTSWYKQTQASVRKWEALKTSDPASAEARLREEEARIWDMQLQMGVTPDSKATQEMAQKSLRMGWESSQLQDAVATQLHYAKGVTPVGSISTTMQQLKQTAANYFIKLDDETAFNYAKSVLAGEHSAQDWQGIWADQAKQKLPTIAQYIDKGITPEQYFSPAKQRIAATLEINPQTVDFNDTRWNKVINTTDDKGQTRPMTDNEIDVFARSQDEFKHTRQAQSQAADLAETLLQTFGKVVG